MITSLILASLVCMGIHKTTDEGMIFERLGNWIKKAFGSFWSKPLVACMPCMSSVHGTWFFFCFMAEPLKYWPLFVLALAGMNWLLILITYKLDG